MSRESVLITGGAGFIGRALTGLCLREGHPVTIIDNLRTGSKDNLDPFLSEIKLFEIDILDGPRVRSVMEAARPKIVFHLAAIHFIPYCDGNPSETLRVNVEGTMTVLMEAARLPVRAAVIASSGALYPSHDDRLTETLQAAPADVYSLSKWMTEQVVQFIAESTEVPCVAARLFNTYGPYETNPHLIPHIVQSLKASRSVSLGNIHTKRDYIYVDDVASALYKCAEELGRGYTTVNVGTGFEYSAEEIVETIGQLLGQNIRIRVDQTRVRSVDKLHQRADTRRLKELTGLRETTSLFDGLRQLLIHERMLANSPRP